MFNSFENYRNAFMKELEIKEVTDRLSFFQTVQLLPLTHELNFQGWLKNFEKGEDRYIASLIADFFIYYPDFLVDNLMESAMQNIGYELSKRLSYWHHNFLYDKCYYSYIPGEVPEKSDSGILFTRKLKDMGVPPNRVIDFDKIYETLLSESFLTPIIFIDDFVGSGQQCHSAWNKNRKNQGKTLNEIQKEIGNLFIFAPLVANEIGEEAIGENCPNLIFSPVHTLGNEYNLFHKSCYCWKGDDRLYEKGVELIETYSKKLGITDNKGSHTEDVRGYYNQGLAIKFKSGAPDAVPAFFYWEKKGWTKLFTKLYDYE
jgi:hypothetical protein